MVAIKDIEMPTDCMECMFCNHIKSNDYGTYGDCVILGDKEQINLLLHQKHSDCPLFLLEERKVGKWIGEKGYPICDKCGCDVIGEYISKTEYAEMYKPMKFCPNCGADMRGSENDL